MKMILSFTLGTMDQTAFINDGGKVSEEHFNIADTAEFIFSHPNVTEITFIGPTAIIGQYATKVRRYELSNYGANKITYKMRERF